MESEETNSSANRCEKSTEYAIQNSEFKSSYNHLNETKNLEKEMASDSTTQKEKRPPRSERKRRHHEELLLRKRENRKKKKMETKERKREKTDTQSDDARAYTRSQEEIRRRCEEGMKSGQIICIDCSLEHLMSDKEKGKLAMQVGRLYGSNRRADNPAHVYLTGLKKGGQLYQEMVKKNSGFENYLIDVQKKTHLELFPLERIVYLSPDSCNPLSDIDQEKVYVIGGLVDEGIKKNVTQNRAVEASIPTARLPIQEYMTRQEGMPSSQVLAVNQVFDILLNFTQTRDWSQALAAGVPRRKGFITNSNEVT